MPNDKAHFTQLSELCDPARAWDRDICQSVHSSIHPFIAKMDSECLLYVRHYSGQSEQADKGLGLGQCVDEDHSVTEAGYLPVIQQERVVCALNPGSVPTGIIQWAEPPPAPLQHPRTLVVSPLGKCGALEKQRNDKEGWGRDVGRWS